jgi:hypothetical protein
MEILSLSSCVEQKGLNCPDVAYGTWHLLHADMPKYNKLANCQRLGSRLKTLNAHDALFLLRIISACLNCFTPCDVDRVTIAQCNAMQLTDSRVASLLAVIRDTTPSKISSKEHLLSDNVPAMLEPTSLRRDDGKRPDDLAVLPLANGQCLVWYFTCPDTLTVSHLNRAVTNLWRCGQRRSKPEFDKIFVAVCTIFCCVSVAV